MRNTKFVRRTNEFTYLGSSLLIVFLVPLYSFLFISVEGAFQYLVLKSEDSVHA